MRGGGKTKLESEKWSGKKQKRVRDKPSNGNRKARKVVS